MSERITELADVFRSVGGMDWYSDLVTGGVVIIVFLLLVVAVLVARQRGRPLGNAALLGLFLGPLGVVLVFLEKPTR